MKKLKSIKGIPLSYIQSILKIDSKSTSNLTWLSRKNVRWNTRFANKSAGYEHTSTKDGYKRWMINVAYNDKDYFLTCSRIILLLHNGYLTEGKQVDHKDVNSLNNSIDNLRELTPRQNQHNRKIQKNNTSLHTKRMQHITPHAPHLCQDDSQAACKEGTQAARDA